MVDQERAPMVLHSAARTRRPVQARTMAELEAGSLHADFWSAPVKPETRDRLIEITLCILLLPPMLVGAIMVAGMMIDGVAEHQAQHDRCLKRATNGYEIKQCR